MYTCSMFVSFTAPSTYAERNGSFNSVASSLTNGHMPSEDDLVVLLFLCMCVCMSACVCVHVYVHVSVHVCACMCMCMYMYIVCVYVRVRACTSVCMFMHVCMNCVSTWVWVCVVHYIDMCMYLHSCKETVGQLTESVKEGMGKTKLSTRIYYSPAAAPEKPLRPSEAVISSKLMVANQNRGNPRSKTWGSAVFQNLFRGNSHNLRVAKI